MSQQDSSVRLFSDVFFIYIQQGDKHYTDRMEAHQLRYVLHGEMTVDDGHQQLKVGSGRCVFLRRDHRIKTRKYPLDKEDFQCITLVFQRDFLRTYFRELDRPSLDSSLPRFDESVILLPRLQLRNNRKMLTISEMRGKYLVNRCLPRFLRGIGCNT